MGARARGAVPLPDHGGLPSTSWHQRIGPLQIRWALSKLFAHEEWFRVSAVRTRAATQQWGAWLAWRWGMLPGLRWSSAPWTARKKMISVQNGTPPHLSRGLVVGLGLHLSQPKARVIALMADGTTPFQPTSHGSTFFPSNTALRAQPPSRANWQFISKGPLG